MSCFHIQGGIAETIPWFFQIFSAMNKDISLIFWLWHNTMCRTLGFYGFHYTNSQLVSVAISILGGLLGYEVVTIDSLQKSMCLILNFHMLLQMPNI